MKAISLSLTLLLSCVAASAQTWQPIVNLHLTGYCDSWNRCVYRTNSGTLYMIVNDSPVGGGASTIKVLKATGQNPTSLTDMDAAHEPTDGSRFIGVDGRLNTSTGIISILYEPTNTVTANYITFNTNTDTWGTSETIATVNAQDDLRYLSKTALALDTNGIPHVTFGGANEGFRYSNRTGGTWSASFTLTSNANDRHTALVMGTDNTLHLAWLAPDSPRKILYRERSSAGTWAATETVDASVGTNGDMVDQSPSIALDSDGLPLILYHEQTSGNSNVMVKKRTAPSTYVDYSPATGLAAGHDWSIAVSWAGDWTICGHYPANNNPIEPACVTRIGGVSGTWGSRTLIVNDGVTRDGSTTIRYDPIYPGTTNTIDVEESDENTPNDDWFYNADITGATGGTTPTATVSPTSLTFPNQVIGTSSTAQTVTVTNTGGGSLTISSITVPTGYSETDNCSSALSQGASCQINVTFTPPSLGSFSSSLSIADNASNSPQAVSLSGTGVAQASSISGTITPVAGGSGVTVTLSGASTATVTANSSGVYTFNGLADGNYTVTPSQAGETFSPANRAVTISGANVTGINFTAIANAAGETIFTSQSPAVVGASDGSSANYELGVAFTSDVAGSVTAIRFWKDARETGTHTGHLWTASGQLLATAVFTGETSSGWQQASLPGAVQIAANTQYVASVNTGKTYFVVTVGGLATKVTNQDLSSVVGNNGLYGSTGQFPVNSYQHSNYFRDVVFSPSSILLSASGNISPATSGAGTTLTLSGTSTATTTADGNGNYTFGSLSNGSYLVIPSKTGLTFTPTSLTFTLNGSNATALNFSATAQTGSISGTISGGSGATVTLSGAGSATVTSDSNGNYSFSSLPFGTYTVTPSETGFTFTPPSQSATVSSSTPVVVNFTAVAQPAPVLNLTPTTRSFGATQGGANPPSSVVNVSNTGTGTLNYTLTSDQSWLSASPVSGTAPQALTVGVVTGTLVAGTYTGHLTVIASGAQGSPAIVTVTFVVLAQTIVPPALSVAPTALTFASTQGGANPASQTISVTNAGGGTLAFTVATDQSWLSALPASGSAPQSITVGAATGTLTAGTYTGHVTVTAPGVQGSPASVTATFTVAPPAAPGTLLFGNQTVLGNRDWNSLGQAEAFQTTSVSTGTLATLSLYLDTTNTAPHITLGLYTDNSGHPGTLLTQATMTTTTSGAWNTVAVPPVAITSGVKYWIAILASSSGTFRFRDNSSASCGNEGSTQTNLTSLPAIWTRGQIWGNCPVSGYGSSGGMASLVPRSAFPGRFGGNGELAIRTPG